MKKTVLICFAFFFLAHSFAQITVVDEKVIPCTIQPNEIAISPDGNILLVGGKGKKLRVYDTNSSTELASIVVKDVFYIYDVQFAPDGKSFAVAGDEYVIVFDARTYEEKFIIRSNNGLFNSISYSPDSKKLAGVYHQTAIICDLTTSASEVLTIGKSEIAKVVWSPSTSNIVLGDYSNKINIWDITEGNRLITNMSQKDLINGISYSKNGNLLYTCSSTGYINIFDVLTGENIKQLTFSQHYPRFVLPLTLYESIISGGEDGRLIYWSLADYKPGILAQYPEYRLLSCSMARAKNKIAIGLSNKSIHILTLKIHHLPLIKEIVSKKTKGWQQQGKFEKSADYVKRVNDSTRIRQIDLFTQWTIDSLGQVGKKWVLKSTDYDADNESFKLNFIDYPSVLIHVSLNEAESFDQSAKSLQYNNPKFTLGEEEDAYVLMHLEIINPANNKSYSYDKREAVAFNPDKLGLEFDPIDIALPKAETVSPHNEEATGNANVIKVSDIDQQLPPATQKYSDAYALIIGNEDYTKYNSNLSPESNVPFARNDAKSFYSYAMKVLGIPSENIFFFTDAIGSVMKREVEKICKMANYRDGKADIFFYFAGHGLPDEETKESYILPVDISTENLKDGIKLTDLYRKFSFSKAHRTVVIVDACFSGEGRNQSLLAARAVRIKPLEAILEGNIVVMTAGNADQRSLPFNQQKHGIFTYFLLKHLKETNGSASIGNLERYLCEEVPITSLKLFGIEQTPQISSGTGIDPKWKEWTLKKGE